MYVNIYVHAYSICIIRSRCNRNGVDLDGLATPGYYWIRRGRAGE